MKIIKNKANIESKDIKIKERFNKNDIIIEKNMN